MVTYVALAYALSWAWWVPLAVGGDVVRSGFTPTHLPGLLGPMLAALLVESTVAGRLGLQQLLRSMSCWRIGAGWWLVTLSPLLLTMVVFSANGLMTGAWPSVTDLGSVNGFPTLAGGAGVAVLTVLLVVVNGFGEETGWRGLLLPRLQRRMRPIPAVMLLTVVWAGWHLPLFWVVESFRSFSAATVVGFLIGMFSGAVVLAWIFNHTGSVLAVACWHAAYNLGSAPVAARGVVATVVTSVVIAQAVVLIVMETARGGGVLLPSRSAVNIDQPGHSRHTFEPDGDH
ncbi:type II CAAX endopeptidase family protein [Actinomadura chokoriensis]